MSCLLGGFTGAAYGLVLSLTIGFFTGGWHPNIIGWSAAVFAFLGYFYGNLIGEAILALMHFSWGLINGLSDNWRPIEEPNSDGYLRIFLLVGFGTGLALMFWWLW